MKPYRYFKTLAKIGLAGNFLKSIVAFLFIILIPELFSLALPKLNITKYIIIPIAAVSFLVLIPCFRMGAVGFVYDLLFKKETSLGNIFDGFKYYFKLLPLLAAEILPFLTLGILTVSIFKNISPEAINILTEYIENPMENILSLVSISDKDYVLILLLENVIIGIIAFLVFVTPYFSLTEYILYNEKLSGFKALFKSMKLMKGHILYYIGFNFSFILWHLASSITMGIADLILIPYKEASFILFYNYLRFQNGETEIPDSMKEAEIIQEENKEE